MILMAIGRTTFHLLRANLDFTTIETGVLVLGQVCYQDWDFRILWRSMFFSTSLLLNVPPGFEAKRKELLVSDDH